MLQTEDVSYLCRVGKGSGPGGFLLSEEKRSLGYLCNKVLFLYNVKLKLKGKKNPGFERVMILSFEGQNVDGSVFPWLDQLVA